MTRFDVALLALAATAGCTALELSASIVGGHPLDPSISMPGLAMAWAAMCAVVVPVAVLVPGRKVRRIAVGLAAWGGVAWPELLRTAVGAGEVAGLTLATLGLGVAWRWPRAGLVLAVGAVLGTPVSRGLHAGQQESSERASVARGPQTEKQGRAPNILLVTVDTVRADAGLVSALGPGWRSWETAVSAAPWTLPSVLSLFTGLPVRDHGGGLATGAPGAWTQPIAPLSWLPQELAAQGYATSAVVSNPYLRARQGFSTGFERYLHHDDARLPLTGWAGLELWQRRWSGGVGEVARSRDSQVTAQAQLWLAQSELRPQFIWVHLLGPHEYQRDPAITVPGWPDDPDALRAVYAGNVARAATSVRALADAAEGWLVVVTSDHGEALGEDGYFAHGNRLNDLQLRVPLAARGPGISPGQQPLPVALVDVAPALLRVAAGQPFVLPTAAAEVGGVRRDPTRFARREVDGRYSQRPGLAVGEALPLEAEQQRALEALGYIEQALPPEAFEPAP